MNALASAAKKRELPLAEDSADIASQRRPRLGFLGVGWIGRNRMEAIIADVSIFPDSSNEKIALYQLFARLFTSVSLKIPAESAPSAYRRSDLVV